MSDILILIETGSGNANGWGWHIRVLCSTLGGNETKSQLVLQQQGLMVNLYVINNYHILRLICGHLVYFCRLSKILPSGREMLARQPNPKSQFLQQHPTFPAPAANLWLPLVVTMYRTSEVDKTLVGATCRLIWKLNTYETVLISKYI